MLRQMTSNAATDVDLVFVLGTGRCGSSLVAEVLCRHPGVGFVSNLDDRFSIHQLGSWTGRLYRRLPASTTQKGRLRYAPSEAYRALDREVSPLLSRPPRDLVASDVTHTLERRFRDFFVERARSQRSAMMMHKFTGWPRAGFISAVFPKARFIHIVRDGRAVANSWLQMPWWLGYKGPEQWQWGPLTPEQAEVWDRSGRSFVVLAGLLWQTLIDAHVQARAAVAPDAWLEIRYEDINAQPRDAFASMLAFCGLPWHAEFERGYALHTFKSMRTDAYRRDLTPSDVALLTQTLERSLNAHGYDSSA
jgi:Sulfotransferase family